MSEICILLADDEKRVTDYLAPLLERTGYLVLIARDGQMALHKVHDSHPDLIIMDVLLPGMSGREVCRKLRSEGNWTLIIMLSCNSETVERILCLEEGADDCLSKPFESQELIARIKSFLRREGITSANRPLKEIECLQSYKIVLNRRLRRLEVDKKSVTITNKAFCLLEYLMLNPEQIFTREQLLNAVWGWSNSVTSRVVDVRIAELRHVLEENRDEPQYIESIIGVGYRFIAKVERYGLTHVSCNQPLDS
jgi:DNA-binding response OmpR family regulator